MFSKNSLLKRAYKIQFRIEQERRVLREKERKYEASRKELGLLFLEAKENKILQEGNYILQVTVEKGNTEVDKEKFLKEFGQEAFNEAACIKLNAAEAAVSKSALVCAKGVLFKKDVFKDKIIKL